MEELLGHIKILIYIGVPLVAFVTAFVSLRWSIKTVNTKVDTSIKAVTDRVNTIEKEYIKELNDVDDKLDRVFALFEKNNGIREKFEEKYLTKNDHKKDCRLKTMEINDAIRESGDEIKKAVADEVTQVRGDLEIIRKVLERLTPRSFGDVIVPPV